MENAAQEGVAGVTDPSAGLSPVQKVDPKKIAADDPSTPERPSAAPLRVVATSTQSPFAAYHEAAGDALHSPLLRRSSWAGNPNHLKTPPPITNSEVAATTEDLLSASKLVATLESYLRQNYTEDTVKQMEPVKQVSSVPSLGSALHAERNCRPCAWHWKKGGCINGAVCTFCHLCEQDELSRRKKEKIARLRACKVPPSPQQPAAQQLQQQQQQNTLLAPVAPGDFDGPMRVVLDPSLIA